MNKKELLWALPMLALMTLAGCHHQGDAADSSAQQAEPQVVVEEFSDTVELELVPEEEEPAPAVEPQRAALPPAGKKASQAPSHSKNETLYVETEGAQGRVWGHVTMKGDRGSGTIHDWDENTFAVTVTRHGNELYAVDQNSRQYVFKLR